MLLKQGDVGDAVKGLQRGLNKLGSMLLIDGDFGPVTREAVIEARDALKRPGPPEADEELQQAVAACPDPFPPLTAAGITFIARAEVSSPAEYRRKYKRPVWPSAESGITIGIGYDLLFVDRERLNQDWKAHLSANAMGRFAEVLGRPGSADRLARVGDLEVPLLAAMSVFLRNTLPRFLAQARSIYPQVEDLPPARRTALVSLVYNRGTRLEDKDPARQDRREMREIRALLASGRPDAVADQLESMVRLWDPEKLKGLVRRRRDEARLWRAGFAGLNLD
jgi:peptidoglycan hydrolase-like protein with peptidoglycan-binding domain